MIQSTYSKLYCGFQPVVDLRRATPTGRRFFVQQSLPRFSPSYNGMPSVQHSLPCSMRILGAPPPEDLNRKSGPSVTRVRATPPWSPAMDSIDDETQEVLDRYLRTFQSADSNGDGMLQRDELRDLLERAGGGAELVPLHWLNEKDIDLIFRAYDTNGDGMISFDEFVPLAHDNCWLTKELDAYRSAFAAIDTGGNGTISPTELCEIFTRLGSPFQSYEKICAIMEKYDLDHNGTIDFGEFLRLCRYENALPLEEILQYAQTRTSGQKLKGGDEEKKAGHILDPAGAKTVRSLSSEGQLMAIFQSFPDDLIVLECVLTWCRPCKKMVPVFEKIAAAYPAAHFYKLTGNESEATKFLFKERLKARVTPSFFFFRGGELVTSCTGANPTRFEDTLRSALRDSERPEIRLYEVSKDENEGSLSRSPVASS